MKWLKHAFAVDSPDALAPTEMQRNVIDKVSREIVRRQLASPALMLLEMSRPLNYVSAQFLHFIQPFASMISDAKSYQQLTEFLEQRGSIDYICKRIEAMEAGHEKD